MASTDYIHLFETVAEFNEEYNGEGYHEPWVSYTIESSGLSYNKISDPLAVPLTIEMLQNGSINLYGTYSYSLNNGEWVDIEEDSLEMNLSIGDKMSFKGLYGLSLGYGAVTGNFKVYGNIMSLRCGDNFASALDIPANTTFEGCFQDNGYLISANELLLPATGLTVNCYHAMFQGCNNMTHGPAILPATTLSESCYYWMFMGCLSLTSVPELPATTLANYCYAGMFTDCWSLTTAPELPASTLEEECYGNMFDGCSGLTYIKCLATDISASQCTYNWVSGVSSSGTFVKDASMSSWPSGVSGIPNNWTVQDA